MIIPDYFGVTAEGRTGSTHRSNYGKDPDILIRQLSVNCNAEKGQKILVTL